MWKLNKEVAGFPAGTIIEPISGSCGSYSVFPRGATEMIRVRVEDIDAAPDVTIEDHHTAINTALTEAGVKIVGDEPMPGSMDDIDTHGRQ